MYDITILYKSGIPIFQLPHKNLVESKQEKDREDVEDTLHEDSFVDGGSDKPL